MGTISSTAITIDGECFTCGELPVGHEETCTKAKRPCGHHCNCTWTNDHCHWCDGEWNNDTQQFVIPECEHCDSDSSGCGKNPA